MAGNLDRIGGPRVAEYTDENRLTGGANGPPTNDQAKRAGNNPRDILRCSAARARGNTVLALSRTLCDGSADAAAFAAACLTGAARGTLPAGRSKRRDGRFRSNKGMRRGCSRAGGVPNLVAGVEQRLLFEQRAGHRQQAVGDVAQGAAVAATALAQCGIIAAAESVVLGCPARPMRGRVREPFIAGITTQVLLLR